MKVTGIIAFLVAFIVIAILNVGGEWPF